MFGNRSSIRLLSTLAVLGFAILAIGVQARRARAGDQGKFHQVAKYKVGGEGSWDYLTIDSAARRVYISRATRVMVMDADTGAVVGEIPGTNGVHGIALAPELGKGFVSAGRDGKVVIFDLKSLKTVGEAKAGTNPDAIIYDDASKRVFAFNGASKDFTAIDAATGDVVGGSALGGKPEFAASDGKGSVFVNIEDKSEVVALDSAKLSIRARWPLAPGEEPSGLAIDRAHSRLFVGCGGNQKMVVMDTGSGHVVTALPTGRGVDANGFDPGAQLAFSSNGDGTLTVVHEDSPDKFTVVDNVTTQRGARTMAVDLKTHNVFLVTAEFNQPPAPTADNPRPRPSIIPGTFTVLVYGM
jgi:DNA-binding beta-propeller fold protein YncE